MAFFYLSKPENQMGYPLLVYYMEIKTTFKNKKFTILFSLIGALGGFLYWRYIGCLSGTCVIRSVWYWSTLWGAAVGYLAGDILNDFILKRRNKAEEKE
jgi:hypothetical protein